MSTNKQPLAPLPPRWVRNTELAKYLNVSSMTLWRWQRDPAMGFPQPSNKIGEGRRAISYTNLNDVDAWMRSRVSRHA
jgi:predicted DNA-binding transcriptional regulator AlpA